MEFDDDLQENVFSMKALCRDISSIGVKFLDGMLSELDMAFISIQDTVFKIVKWGIPLSSNECDSRFDVHTAEHAPFVIILGVVE